MSQSKSIILIFAALLGAITMVMYVLIGGANEVVGGAKILTAGSILLALYSPRVALYWMFIAAGYVDLLKRFFVFGGRIRYMDLYSALSLVPLTLLAIALSLLVGILVGTIPSRRLHFKTLAFAVGLSFLAFIVEAKSGGIGPALKTTTDVSAYAMLLFIVPILYPTQGEILKLVRIICLCYLPMAAYVYWQRVFGFNDFEIQYLKSGLSIEIKQLFDVTPRPFSTLNSPFSAGTVSAILASHCLILAGSSKRYLLYLTLFAFYVGACLMTLSRTSNLVWILAPLLPFLFRSPSSMKATYIVTIVGFLILCFSAEKILRHLPDWNESIVNTMNVGGSGWQVQAARLGTFGDRLVGYTRLITSPKMYSLFGKQNKFEVYGEVYSHDIIGGSIITYGLVPCLIVAGIGIYAFRRVHRIVFQAEARLRSQLMHHLAIVQALLLICVLGGSIIFVFPVNAFFWLSMAALLVVPVGRTVPEPAPTPAGLPEPHIHHGSFRRNTPHTSLENSPGLSPAHFGASSGAQQPQPGLIPRDNGAKLPFNRRYPSTG